VLSEGQTAVDGYLDFLKMGGSAYPLDELRCAGVDMTSKEPVSKAIAHFETLVKGLRQAVASL